MSDRKRMPTKSLVLDGGNIHDIPSFYDEINRVFMADESWRLANSLDALNDMLYGAYGAAQGDAPITLTWKDAEKSRDALGLDATRRFYRLKLQQPHRHDPGWVHARLADLEDGNGPTFFQMVVDLIAGHPRFELKLI